MLVKAENIDKVTKTFMMMPGIFERARKSSLKSLGWWIMGEVRNHVEYGGDNWPDLHPLTEKFRKKYNLAHKWVKRRSAPPSPLFWLGKFARYRVDDEGTLVHIDFGKSRKGRPGTMDPKLVHIAKRAEEGDRIQVTEKMRRMWAATKRKRPKGGKVGDQFHALKKSTNVLKVPPRPIFGPVFKKVQPKAGAYFRDKFWKAIDRYTKGTKKTWT